MPLSRQGHQKGENGVQYEGRYEWRGATSYWKLKQWEGNGEGEGRCTHLSDSIRDCGVQLRERMTEARVCAYRLVIRSQAKGLLWPFNSHKSLCTRANVQLPLARHTRRPKISRTFPDPPPAPAPAPCATQKKKRTCGVLTITTGPDHRSVQFDGTVRTTRYFDVAANDDHPTPNSPTVPSAAQYYYRSSTVP